MEGSGWSVVRWISIGRQSPVVVSMWTHLSSTSQQKNTHFFRDFKCYAGSSRTGQFVLFCLVIRIHLLIVIIRVSTASALRGVRIVRLLVPVGGNYSYFLSYRRRDSNDRILRIIIDFDPESWCWFPLECWMYAVVSYSGPISSSAATDYWDVSKIA